MGVPDNCVNSPKECLVGILRTALVSAVLISAFCHDACVAAPDSKRATQEQRRDKRNVNPGTTNATSARLAAILAHFNRDQGLGGNPELMRYTPTTPSPENVNCYVEVPVTRRVGGRCVPLGSQMGCQAGIYLELSSDCMNLSPNATPQRGISRAGSFLARIRNRGGRFAQMRHSRQHRRGFTSK